MDVWEEWKEGDKEGQKDVERERKRLRKEKELAGYQK